MTLRLPIRGTLSEWRNGCLIHKQLVCGDERGNSGAPRNNTNIGGEIEAVFGTPPDDPNHADKAIAAAPDMRARLGSLNERRSRLSNEPLTG